MPRLKRHSSRVFVKVLAALLIVLGTLISGISTLSAEPTYTVNYQGKLTTPAGVAVPDGTYNMRFWLLTTPSIATTSAVWTESLTGANRVQVTNGLFSVMLGSTSALTSVDFNQPLYLGVEIGGTGSPAWDGEMSPRKIIGTVPSAFEAKQLGGVASSSFLRSDQADSASGLLTFTGGFISSASSTVRNLTTLTATTTNLVVNGERFTDLTGTGLQNSAGVLSVNVGALDAFFASTTDFDTSAELDAIVTDDTGSGALVFATSPVFTTNIDIGSAGVRISDDGDGAITFLGLGNGSDENLTLNLDDTANTGVFTSSTGLNQLTFTSIGLDAEYINTASGATSTFDGDIAMNEVRIFSGSSGTPFLFVGQSGFGGGNTAVGADSLTYSQTYTYPSLARNTAMGSWSASVLIEGTDNTAIGDSALSVMATGTANTAIGQSALYSLTEGFANTALGVYAGGGILDPGITFSSSTFIGYSAGYNATSGASANILIGYQAADNLTTGNNNIIIGYDIDAVTATADNRLNIGNLIFGDNLDGTGTTLASGNIGVGTTSLSAKLTVAQEALAIGSELITNGTFTGNANGWSLITGCVDYGSNKITFLYDAGCQSGEATLTASTTFAVVAGHTYKLTFTVSDVSNEEMFVSFETNNDNIFYGDDEAGSYVNGTYELYFVSSFTGTETIYFDSYNYTNNGTWSLDDVSIRDMNERPSFAVYDTDGANLFSVGSILGNVTLGKNTLPLTNQGGYNTAVGEYAGSSNTIGYSNSFFGYMSGLSNTTGVRNVFLGAFAGASSTNAGDNLFAGLGAGYNNTSGSYNVFLGSGAGRGFTTGSDSVFIGYNAGYSNSGLGSNVFVGARSGYTNTSGEQNVFIGEEAGDGNTGASFNTFVGTYAGSGTNTGANNSFFGRVSGLANTSGASGSFFGVSSGQNNTTGGQNTHLGTNAGFYNQTGWGNVTVGYNAGEGTNGSSYSSSTMMGYGTGLSLTTGSRNILLGYQAGDALTTGSNNIVIGYNIDAPGNTTSNQMTIGNIIFGLNVDATGTTVDTNALIGIADASPSQILDIDGTNAQVLVEESTTEFLRSGVGETSNTSIIGWDDSDALVLGLYDSPTDTTISSLMTILSTGLVGIATTTPWQELSVTGDLALTGRIYDNAASAGSNGMVLQSTGSGFNWVSTSSLNITASVAMGASITSATQGSVFFAGASGVLAQDNANFFFDDAANRLGLGSTTPWKTLSVTGEAVITSTLTLGGAGVSIANDGDGAITFQGLGDGSDENLIMNLDDTSNTIAFSSGTGVTVNTFTMALDSASYVDSTEYRIDGTKILDANLTSDSIFIGESAASTNVPNGALYNIALGFGAMANTTSANNDNNIAIGYQAGWTVAQGYNIFIGHQAGWTAANGTQNVAIGVSAGLSMGGSANAALGFGAGYAATNTQNVFLGYYAGIGNTGRDNLMSGYYAGGNNAGDYNNLLGTYTGYYNRGDYNEFIGYQTGNFLNATSTVAIGAEALMGYNGGSGARYTAINNVALGYRAGYNATNTADNNILIGYQVADNLTTGNNNIIIGYDIDSISATADNVLNIGNLLFGTGIDGTGTTLSSGKIGIGTSSPTAKFEVVGGGEDLMVISSYQEVSTTTTTYGVFGELNLNASGSSLGGSGLYGNAFSAPTNGQDYNEITGVVGVGQHTGFGDVTTLSGVSGALAVASGTVSTANAINALAFVADGTVTNLMGMRVQSPTSFGAVTNSYGIYIEDQGTVGSVRNYNLYSSGSATLNMIEGSLDLGTAGVRLSHDGDGAITFLGMGNGSDEDLTLNLDDTADTGVFTSSTGLATLNFSSIALQESGSAVLSVADLDTCAEFAALGSIETGTCGTVVLSTSPTITTPRIATIYGGTAASSQLTLNSTTGSGTTDDIIMGVGTNGGTQAFRIDNENNSITFGENAGATFTSNTTNNLAIGFEAGRYASTTLVDYNALIGYQAGYYNTGYYNNAIGVSAGYSNSGHYGNYIGQQAGASNSGNYSNLIGWFAGYDNSAFALNAFGREAGYNNIGSSANFFGVYAGYSNQGDGVDFFGEAAGRVNRGDFNQMIGYHAGYNLNATSSTIIGAQAFYGDNEGGTERTFAAINNVAIGYRAGYNATNTADNNILIGYQVADNLTTGNNNIIIGYDIDSPAATADNILNIGNTIFGTGISSTGTTIDTDARIGIGTSTPVSRFAVTGDAASAYIATFFNDGNDANRYGISVIAGADDGSGTTYYLNAYDGDGDNVGYIANTAGTFALNDVSDRRTKTNITATAVTDALSVIGDLRVVDFNRLADPDGPRITGFIAQEVQEVYPYAVNEAPNGYLALMKDAFIPLLVKGSQEQQALIAANSQQLSAVGRSLLETIATVETLESKILEGVSFEIDEDMEVGTIVTRDEDGTRLAHYGESAIGVVREVAENGRAVVMNGEAMVYVNLEGGSIAVGDRITLSSVAGVGTKATTTSFILGTALESTSASGTIAVLLSPDLYFTADAGVQLANAFAALDAEVPDDTLWSRLSTLATNFVDGVLTVAGIKADSITANEEICIDDVCLTKDALREILQDTHTGNVISEPTPQPQPAEEPTDGNEETSTDVPTEQPVSETVPEIPAPDPVVSPEDSVSVSEGAIE